MEMAEVFIFSCLFLLFSFQSEAQPTLPSSFPLLGFRPVTNQYTGGTSAVGSIERLARVVFPAWPGPPGGALMPKRPRRQEPDDVDGGPLPFISSPRAPSVNPRSIPPPNSAVAALLCLSRR